MEFLDLFDKINEHFQSRLIRKMKYSKINLLFLLLSTSVFAQPEAEEIRHRLRDFQINEDWLSSNLKEEDAIHYYRVKSVTGSKNGNVTSIAEYDPRRKSGDRTHLLTVNGKEATKQEKKKYRKRFGNDGEDANGKIDSNSYKILKDNDDWFVIEFQLIKESLPDRYKFLGDCEAELHCRKDIMKASYARFRNLVPTKVKMFEADKVDIEIYFKFDEETQSYVHEEARYYMDAKVLGVSTEVELLNYYSDYKVVK